MRDRDLSRTEPREASDPIARDAYSSKQTKESDGKHYPEQKASATPVQKEAEQQPLDKSEEQPDAAIAASAMAHTVPQPVGAAAGQPSPMAQLGSSAYQLAPHGVGEFAFAEEAGLFPPGSANPAGNPLGAQAEELIPSALFQARTLPEAEVVEPTKGMSAVDVLNLSRKATEEVLLGDEALLEERLGRNPFASKDVLQLTQPAQNAQQVTAHAYLSQLLNQDLQEHIFKDAPKAPARSGLAEFSTSMGLESASLSTHTNQPGAATAANVGAYAAAESAQADTARMMERIAEQARWIIRNGRQEVTMKLSPEHLGDMKLKVVRTEHTMRVEMTVDTLVAKNTLESNLDDLQNKLQAQNPGTENFEFNVDVKQHHDPRQSETFYTPSRDALAPGNKAGIDSVQAQEILTSSRPRWGTRGVGVYA